MTSIPAGVADDLAIERLFSAVRAGLYSGHLTIRGSDSSERVVVANRCLRTILGCPVDATLDSLSLFGRDRYADAGVRQHLLEALRSGGVTDYLAQLRRADGTPVWVEITATVGTMGDQVLTIDALVRDVSERRQLEERSRELYSQLARSEQLAAISRTLKDAAHELQNPLSTILAWAERLAEQALDDRTRKGASQILLASERAGRIVRNALQPPIQHTRALVDVNAVVKETLDLRRHDQLAMNITVHADFGDALPVVFGDAHQIQQVLLNVIINAEQAMVEVHGHGAVAVRTWADPRRQLVTIEVSDDGPGVPEAIRSRIFDPFFTTKQALAGTGLGLAVAQALMYEHGGSIRLGHPDAAGGARFLIELPARDRGARTTP